jgi:SpoVK/Ycf46/Vps4 family AAA+-type ATPase
MDKAYIRRFTYLVSFENPDKRIREKIWQKTISENGLILTKDDIKDLSEGYQLPPAIISSVVKSTKLVNGGTLEIKNALSMYEKAMDCHYNIKKTNQELSFDPKLLNTNTDMEQLANRLSQIKSLAFSLCLYGASGTGKSAYARYIAKKLDMEVVEKKASDLFDKYVGETEKNIAKAFAEAREKNALLIFDEADSLLQDRNFTQQSWETMQVNEMLTQMESHQLPFICTTNLMDKIDKASLRRFTFKIKYDYLTTEQVIQAFKHFLGRTVSIEEVQNLKFLTPGDFAVVNKKIKILDLDYIKDIVDLLQEEMDSKGEKSTSLKMGFV